MLSYSHYSGSSTVIRIIHTKARLICLALVENLISFLQLQDPKDMKLLQEFTGHTGEACVIQRVAPPSVLPHTCGCSVLL